MSVVSKLMQQIFKNTLDFFFLMWQSPWYSDTIAYFYIFTHLGFHIFQRWVVFISWRQGGSSTTTKKPFSAPQPHSPGEQWEKTVNLKAGSYLWNSLWKKNQLWVCKEQSFRNTNIKNIASVIIVILAIVISHFPCPSSHIWNGAERENLSEFWPF